MNRTTMINFGIRQRWEHTGEKYQLVTSTICPFCKEQDSLLVVGQSHDDEPMLSFGTYACGACFSSGAWKVPMLGIASGLNFWVGESGIGAPTIIALNLPTDASEAA